MMSNGLYNKGGKLMSDDIELHRDGGLEVYDTMGEVSDGYHTFNELYEFRKLYNAALFNEIHYTESQYGGSIKPVKSWKHSDGEPAFGGGWFVVSCQLPTGQITNHYEADDWDLFIIPEVETAPEWDGHTPADVVERLTSFIKSYKSPEIKSRA